MQTVYDQIRTGLTAVFRNPLCHAKMRPMGFIHDQGDVLFMQIFRNERNLGQNAFISR